MKQKKKSRFFSFCFAFMPGAAEMYMGFMKMGFSIMAIFLLTVLVGVAFRAEEVLLFVCALEWFYAFFHARNIATCDDAEFNELKDLYIWEDFGDFGKINNGVNAFRKYIAYILIIAGIIALWGYAEEMVIMFIPDDFYEVYHNVIRNCFDNVPRIAISIALIVFGAKMIKGKKMELDMAGCESSEIEATKEEVEAVEAVLEGKEE